MLKISTEPFFGFLCDLFRYFFFAITVASILLFHNLKLTVRLKCLASILQIKSGKMLFAIVNFRLQHFNSQKPLGDLGHVEGFMKKEEIN